jgi:Ala-tRNA(Pro) deacylase
MTIFTFLEQNGIDYQRFDHPPVFTCEEAERLVPHMPGIKNKNLFLRDRRGKLHFLVIVPAEKTVDLKGLSRQLDAPGLSFASPERLMKYLKVEPGSVSFLSIYSDIECNVKVIFDTVTWSSDYLQCHPMTNTSTLLIGHEGVVNILELTGHEYQLLDIPERSPD